MIIWQAGDIISDDKWNTLNNVPLYAKKVEWYDATNNILNISLTELKTLNAHYCIVWYVNDSGYIEYIYSENCTSVDNGQHIQINSLSLS